eukprot:1145517-Pelagomonas_calceolata.AAC.3
MGAPEGLKAVDMPRRKTTHLAFSQRDSASSMDLLEQHRVLCTNLARGVLSSDPLSAACEGHMSCVSQRSTAEDSVQGDGANGIEGRRWAVPALSNPPPPDPGRDGVVCHSNMLLPPPTRPSAPLSALLFLGTWNKGRPWAMPAQPEQGIECVRVEGRAAAGVAHSWTERGDHGQCRLNQSKVLSCVRVEGHAAAGVAYS